MTKVFVVYNRGDGEVSRVFDNEEAADAWVKKGHEGGWLYDEDCYIFEEEVYSSIDSE